jgi:hypothetical protein
MKLFLSMTVALGLLIGIWVGVIALAAFLFGGN